MSDYAFPLKTHLLKLFLKSNLTTLHWIYNYRLSRASRVVENAFGILANRLKFLLQPLNFDIEKVEEIAWTCCCLHNFIRGTSGNDSESGKEGDVGNFVPWSWSSFYTKRITYHWHMNLFIFFDFSVAIFIIQFTFSLSWYNLSPQERHILKAINYANQRSVLKQKNCTIIGASKAMVLNHD